MCLGQSREASSNIAMAMSFLRRTYPHQLADYTGDHLPEALDLITDALTTPTPTNDDRRLSRRGRRRRGRRRRWQQLDLEAFCRQQPTATHSAGLQDPIRGGPTEFWRKRRKVSAGRRRRQPGARSRVSPTEGRPAALATGGGDMPTDLEVVDNGVDNVVSSSAFAVRGASGSADDGAQSSSSVTAAASTTSAGSAAADFTDVTRDASTVAVNNATDVGLYFRTTHLLHYTSIVVLGLFVLQVVM